MGNPLYLKSAYGLGYHLKVSALPDSESTDGMPRGGDVPGILTDGVLQLVCGHIPEAVLGHTATADGSGQSAAASHIEDPITPPHACTHRHVSLVLRGERRPLLLWRGSDPHGA
jgi:hypothetical protein